MAVIVIRCCLMATNGVSLLSNPHISIEWAGIHTVCSAYIPLEAMS